MLARAPEMLCVVILICGAEIGPAEPSPRDHFFSNAGMRYAGLSAIYRDRQVIAKRGRHKESAYVTGFGARRACDCKTQAEMANYIGDNVYQSSIDFRTIRFNGKTFAWNDDHWCSVDPLGYHLP